MANLLRRLGNSRCLLILHCRCEDCARYESRDLFARGSYILIDARVVKVVGMRTGLCYRMRWILKVEEST